MERLGIKEIMKSFETNSIVKGKYFPKTIKKEEDGYTCYFIDLDTGKFVKKSIKA